MNKVWWLPLLGLAVGGCSAVQALLSDLTPAVSPSTSPAVGCTTASGGASTMSLARRVTSEATPSIWGSPVATAQTAQSTLSVGISGPGYFAVKHVCATAYTRCGDLAIEANGQMAIHGDVVTPPETIPASASDITIWSDGQLTLVPFGASASIPVGMINLFAFQHPEALTPLGDGLYLQSAGSGVPLQGDPGDNAYLGTLVETASGC